MRKSNEFDLLSQLVRTNFKLKYNDSILGFLWALLKPFLMFGMLYVIFSNVSRGATQQNYQLYLLIGIIMFAYFSESVTLGMNSLLDKAHIILKVNFNRRIAVYSNHLMAVINLLINLVILAIFTLFNDVHFTLGSLVYFFFLIAVLGITTLGLSFFTSVLFIRFKDLLHITEIALQLLFYASAIFFPLTLVPERISILSIQDIPAREILELNPLFIIIRAARDAYILGEINYVAEIAIIFVIGLILLLLGQTYFKNRVKRVAEYF